MHAATVLAGVQPGGAALQSSRNTFMPSKVDGRAIRVCPLRRATWTPRTILRQLYAARLRIDRDDARVVQGVDSDLGWEGSRRWPPRNASRLW